MYAVIKTGGKQYKIKEGDSFKAEKLDCNEGDEVQFPEVLMISDEKNTFHYGTPYIAGVTVKTKVEQHGLGDKIHIVKFKRRKGYARKVGHRQPYTRLSVTSIDMK